VVVPWQNIDRLRQERGLTLKALAQKAGVTEAAIQKWKHGKPITYETLEKLALALDTTVIALRDGPTAASLPSSSTPQTIREAPAPYGTPTPAEMFRRLQQECAAMSERLSHVERLLIELLARKEKP
jgi:transcriptional regulator with XRE-family HTH domain